jgi:hypothetical protein
MNWLSEWRMISSRINGLVKAGQYFLQTQSNRSQDQYGIIGNQLCPHALSVFESIKAFNITHGYYLPSDAAVCLERLISVESKKFVGLQSPSEWIFHYCLSALIGFQTEFEYFISNRSALITRQADRAFSHLQRSIVADDEIKSKWCKAFDNGEVKCEKLGSVHLLSHGIWCFKVHGDGERTDLVWENNLISNALDEIESVADGLILTEWKVASSPSDVNAKISAAKDQTFRYAAGVLGGIELTDYRYIVVVTKKVMQMPKHEVIDQITFKYINIAVDPDAPSKGYSK